MQRGGPACIVCIDLNDSDYGCRGDAHSIQRVHPSVDGAVDSVEDAVMASDVCHNSQAHKTGRTFRCGRKPPRLIAGKTDACGKGRQISANVTQGEGIVRWWLQRLGNPRKQVISQHIVEVVNVFLSAGRWRSQYDLYSHGASSGLRSLRHFLRNSSS